MKREILFRAKCAGVWRYGHYVHFDKKPTNSRCNINYKDFIVTNDDDGEHYYPISDLYSIAQYTGLTDKNDEKIFEGDILRCYKLDSYCINPDCDLALQGYSGKITKIELPVEYIFDGFCLDDETCYPIPISVCGLNKEDINEIRQIIENDSYFDTNGYKLDDTILGVEIIGNVTDNPD